MKEAAKIEKEYLNYMFQDTFSFVNKIITVYMDEVPSRENIMRFLKLLNASTPFLLLNDFKVSKQNNSLRRVEILEHLIKEL